MKENTAVGWVGLFMLSVFLGVGVGLIQNGQDNILKEQREIQVRLDSLYVVLVGEESILTEVQEAKLELDELCLSVAQMRGLSAFECMDQASPNR